jgi:alpha-mannosidase
VTRSSAQPESRPTARLHVVVLSHLDTQWRWTLRDTVRRWLPRTVVENEALFESRARWTLSFEGAARYRLLADHHPELFETVRRRVAQGRWHPAGAAVEAFDTLLPAPESVLRQIHLGQRWFARELGRESADLFLPDCFGFPATLPTLGAHAGLTGFSTQKLRRGATLRAARPIPFAYGRWRGTDGAELLAALDPGEYSGRIEGDPRLDPAWAERFAELDRRGRPRRLLCYVGTGDRGGAPPEPSVAALEACLGARAGIEVRHAGSDAIYLETGADERARLPVHEGELLLRLHGTGCYTSKASVKRWNRTCERLARAAEAAAASAGALGRAVPRARLREAWWRFLGHQMHDDLTGTSIPAAYAISHAGFALAANELAEILLDSAGAIARALDRSGPEPAVLLFDPLGAAREEVVEVPSAAASDPSPAASATGPGGGTHPAQRIRLADGRPGWAIPARLPAFGCAVHRLTGGATVPATAARADRDSLENDRLRARFDERGDLASLVDKRLGREILAAPVRLQLFDDLSAKYPAWEIRWQDLERGPRAVFARVTRREVVEAGPVRAALEIARSAAGSRIVERWSLAAGTAGDRLECAVTLDWHTPAALLKAAYRFAGSCPEAAYDTGLGAIRRPVSSPDLYEVPAQHWAALDDSAQGFGLAVLSDVKSGWDHPDPATLRLTWLRSPRASFKWRHQRTQDFGRHRFRIALAPFSGDPVEAGVPALADRFTNPVLAFPLDPGGPGRSLDRYELLSVEGRGGLVQALKPEDDGARVVLRLRNPGASSVAVAVRGATATLSSAVELDGRERASGQRAPLAIDSNGSIQIAVPPGGLATLGLAFAEPAVESIRSRAPRFEVLPFSGGLCLCATRGQRASGGGFDGRGRSFPRELVPRRIEDATVPFEVVHLADGSPGALAPGGEVFDLPAGFAELWLLAVSIDGELEADFGLEGDGAPAAVRLRVPDWRAPLFVESRYRSRLRGGGVMEEIVRRVPVAFATPFLRDLGGRDRVAEPGLLFALRVPLGAARRLRLPGEPRLRLVAATLADVPARPLREGAALLP